MAKVHYEGPDRFRPVGAWGYVGYTLLFSLPVIGLLITVVFACSDSRIARRNYARSMLCWLLIGSIALGGAAFAVLSSDGVRKWFRTVLPQAEDFFRLFERDPGRPESGEAALPQPEAKAAEKTAEQTASPGRTAAPGRTPTPRSTAAPGRTARPGSTAAPRRTAAPARTAGASGGIRPAVREAIDAYEAFFREYAEMMKKAGSDDSAGFMTDYFRMLALYAENMAKWESFEEDHDLNDAEETYFLQASLRIEAMLLGAMGE